MARKYLRTFLFVIIIMFANRAFALGDGKQPTPHPKPGVPINGGVLALLAAGAVYAVKKIQDKSR